MIKILREIAGYVLGLVVFVGLMPTLMWLASGRPDIMAATPAWLLVIGVVLMVAGLALSIWSIIHMRVKGEGNPMDAYGHEIAPRTKHLMTDGPYKYSRNPMLLGVYIYDAGVLLWLLSWWPLAIAAVEVTLLTLQVRSEEKRLEKDFGEEYRKYKQQVRRYL